MNEVLAILFAGLLIIIAHVFTVFFERTSVPDVLWLMAIGLAIGPAFGLITPAQLGDAGLIFTTITLANVHALLIGLILIVIILLIRMPIVRFTIPRSVPVLDAAIISAVAVKGLVPAYLAPMPAQLGVLQGGIIPSLTYSAILLSIVASSVLIFLINKTPIKMLCLLPFNCFKKYDLPGH